jgi:hypothetical protein
MLPLNTPIYVYCTLQGMYELFKQIGRKYMAEKWYDKKGKVVAKIEFDSVSEFTCIGNEEIQIDGINSLMFIDLQKETCLTYAELEKYIGIGKKGYAHHISKVEILEPMEIGEFKHWKTKTIYSGMDCPPYSDDVLVNLTRPPQSYCYVEVSDNAK